jgi:hypothetical protein
MVTLPSLSEKVLPNTTLPQDSGHDSNISVHTQYDIPFDMLEIDSMGAGGSC